MASIRTRRRLAASASGGTATAAGGELSAGTSFRRSRRRPRRARACRPRTPRCATARHTPWSDTSRPTSGPGRQAAWRPPGSWLPARRARRRGGGSSRPDPPRSRSCTGSSGTRSRSRATPASLA